MFEMQKDKTDEHILTETESRSIYILKAMAILCVIAAHVSKIISWADCWTFFSSTFWSMLARIGVVLFFTCSGFLFHREKGDGLKFWKKKFFSLIIPWLFCSTLTFALSIFLNRVDNFFLGYIKWIFGQGSWYYYIVVLLIFFVLFKYIMKYDVFLYVCIFLNILSLFLETYSINPISEYTTIIPFLNIFNWIGYFSMGILFRRHRVDRWILKNKIFFWGTIVFSINGIILFFILQIVTDFHIFSIVYKLPLMALLFYASYGLAKLKKVGDLVVSVGKDTYFIYLLHMQIVQPICSRLPVYFEIIKPLIGLGVMIFIIVLIRLICEKLLKIKWPLKILGLR